MMRCIIANYLTKYSEYVSLSPPIIQMIHGIIHGKYVGVEFIDDIRRR